MAKRTTKTSAGKAADDEAAPKRAARPRKTTAKKAAPKRASVRRAEEAPRKPRKPSRVSGLGTAIRDQANRLLAKTDDEAVKAILTAGALAAAAVFLGDKVADKFDDDDTPAGRARLKAAAAAGGAAMGAQLLKTLEQTRERKGLASHEDEFDPKALAAKAVSALIR